ncbi:hypothetical protein RCO27_05280 [Sphingosinicella sp. LHD-64]|uniref:hypothetical protein n=1 Tax=Sphingosinicella sp. LHD-64 TaxID=3072139 RepID=UPI00280E2C15|nr:hypothetical protein [Sphingosinicella sp. LHD-64]MDQ8755634.1 hypothetical protein [Sphingosinicella sp. LHD-64]
MSRLAPQRMGAWMLALLGGALFLRALIPAGWMPVRTTEGFVIELCSGRMPGGDSTQAQAARQLLDAALAGTEQDHDETPSSPNDQPCTFAGLALSWVAPDQPVGLIPAPGPADIRPIALVAAVGRGLPAPPPPSTGPPLRT